MTNILTSDKIFPRMVELRRNLHRHPELAFEEKKTASIVIDELKRLGIPFWYGGVGNGIIAKLINAGQSAPTIALRADMDALPGEENTGLPFASLHPGKMHACGHDGHMAMVLGAAALLKENPPPGNVVFIFQPAEEKGAGAKVMIQSGALEGVNAIFSGHVTRHYHVGEIMATNGVITAHSDGFTIRVRGRGGHGARPHEAVDAVVVTGLLIMAVQTLVSREINPAYPSVVTIGKVEAGSAGNVIAEEATLQGTIRTTNLEVRNYLIDGIKRIATAVGEVHNARIEVEIRHGYPPVINTETETAMARRAVVKLLGSQGLVAMDHPSMGAEDFSFYLLHVPGCYVRFGACQQGCENIPLHSPSFDFDEEALKVGAAFFDAVVREAIAEYTDTAVCN
ncbi:MULTISPECIES: M20 family metallopeptidase [unclassified Anabaena]|uniref:M20 metallopeptidase family protein n=1 Tax=unclassified Anabaena TaxID=2619674 RepID=UPI00082E9214|nr:MULTISPECIES: M20 family metallopeptidase [unclassified Anabaena]